jgi:hypothetical protein
MNNLPVLPDDMRPVLREFLVTHSTLALATAGEQDGRPQVAPLFFASDDDFNIYWISSPDSRHSLNIADWDDVGAAVYEQTWEWNGIKGVQIEGSARAVIGDEEHNRALAVYKAKFPFVNERFEALIEQSIFYVLRPRWIRWLDNARRFGYKQEFSLQDDTPDN